MSSWLELAGEALGHVVHGAITRKPAEGKSPAESRLHNLGAGLSLGAERVVREKADEVTTKATQLASELPDRAAEAAAVIKESATSGRRGFATWFDNRYGSGKNRPPLFSRWRKS